MYLALKHCLIKLSKLFSSSKPGETLCNEAPPSATHSLSHISSCHKFLNGMSKSINRISWLFRIVISASMGADFPMKPRESTLFSRVCEPSSLGIVPCQVTAKASAPQAP